MAVAKSVADFVVHQIAAVLIDRLECRDSQIPALRIEDDEVAVPARHFSEGLEGSAQLVDSARRGQPDTESCGLRSLKGVTRRNPTALVTESRVDSRRNLFGAPRKSDLHLHPVAGDSPRPNSV